MPSDIFLLGNYDCAQGRRLWGDGGTRPLTFWLGDAKVNVPPRLIAHLVKFLGHIFH